MADVDITPAEREISAIMRKVHSTDTVPEVAFREALDTQNIHYLPSISDLPGKPDVVMPAQHVAIYPYKHNSHKYYNFCINCSRA